MRSNINRRRRIQSRVLVAAAAGAVAAIGFGGQSARATSGNWLGATGNTWLTDANWDQAPFPGAAETATFNGAGNGNTTIDLGAGVTIGNIVFDTAAAAAYTIGSGGAGAQTLTFGDTAAVTLNAAVTNNQLFNSNVVLGTGIAGTTTFTNLTTGAGTGKNITFAGTIQGGTGGTAGQKTVNVSVLNGGSVTFSNAITAGGSTGINLVNAGTSNSDTTHTGTLTLSGNVSSTLNTLRATGGGTVVVDGQNVTVASLSNYGATTSYGKFVLQSGSVAFNGGIQAATSGGAFAGADNMAITVNGGTFSASSVGLGRTQNLGTAFLTTASTGTNGFIVNGGTASITGNLNIGGSNSSALGSVNNGTTTVGGLLIVGQNASSGRTNLMQVTGGTLTVNDAVEGIALGRGTTAIASRGQLLLTGGTTTTEKISFGLNGGLAGSSGNVTLNGAAANLYVGSGGIVKAATNAYTESITLTSGTLGAKADWSTTVPIAVNGGVTIKAADAADAAHNITLGGQLTGTGSITKTGAGTLTLAGPNWTGVNNYNANMTVNAGTLAVDQSTNGTYGGIVSGPGAFTKTGIGTFTMSNAQTYTGPTTVAGGTLAINGAQATSSVTVQNGAALALAGNATVNALTLGGGAGDTQTLRVNTGSGVNTLGVLTANSLVANGTTSIDVGSIGVTTGLYTVLDYSGSIGGGGFAAFALGSLPPRVIGNLVNNTGNTSVDLNITGVDFPRWTGAVDGNWDIGTTSPASGTQNWKEVTSGNTTVYLQSSAPGDQVIFNDTATGATSINIVAPVSPAAMTVNNSTKNYTFTGAKISGPGQLIKQGSGTLTLGNPGNDYTGGTTIQGGTVTLATTNALPTAGNLTLTGGTLNINGSQDIAGAFILDGGKVDNGQITKSGAAYELRSGIVGATGVLAGAVAVNKTTAGTVVFNGQGSYTGATTVTEGTLQFGDGVNLGSIPGNITNSGTVAFNTVVDQAWAGAITGSTGTITKTGPGALFVNTELQGNVTVNAGKIVASGSTADPGPSSFNSRLGRFGTLTINNGAIVEVRDKFALGLSSNTNPPRTILNAGGTLFTADGSDTSIYNATFAGGELTGTALSSINMRGDYLASAGTTSTLSHPNISRTNTPDFDIEAGATLNVTGSFVGGGSWAKIGPGTMVLSGVNTYSGGTAVNAGTLLVANADGLGTSPISVADGALGKVQAGLPKAVSITSLNTNATGKFDITNNSLVIKGMTDAAVRTQLQAGYNGGAWTGASGIVSTSITAETSIGYATKLQTGITDFKGVTGMADTDVQVKFTYAGDANLDGKVDIGDLGLLAGAWQATSGKVWFDGDFTYDGKVDIGDLGLLSGNWQKGTAGNPNPPLMDFATAMAQFSAFDGVVVPEPASLSLLALGGLAALGRRRRCGSRCTGSIA